MYDKIITKLKTIKKRSSAPERSFMSINRDIVEKSLDEIILSYNPRYIKFFFKLSVITLMFELYILILWPFYSYLLPYQQI